MISLKVLSSAAAMALLLPAVASTASHAENRTGKGAAVGGVRMGGGGGGAPVARFSGGGGGAPVARFSGGGGGAPVARFSGGGGGAPAARYIGGGGGAPVARFNGGGGGYRYRHGGGGGFIPGVVIGGAIASQGYYGGPGYYAPGYYDDQYYDDGAVAVVPQGGDDVAYCIQTYKSYDLRSGTYLGYDGLRHPCP